MSRLPSSEHPHNLGAVILHSIENSLRSSRQRTQTDPDFVARPTREGKVINDCDSLCDLTQDSVGHSSSCHFGVVAPKTVNIIQSFR
jgi:hypothetical protein